MEESFDQDDELFDKVFGPQGGRPLGAGAPLVDQATRAQLSKREAALKKDMDLLTAELRGRVQQAGVELQEHQRRKG